MKYGLIILLACTPISALTAWSFVELASGGDGDVVTSVAVTPLDVSAVEKQSQELRAAAESLQPLAQSLADSDLLDTRQVELPAVAGGPPSLSDDWNRAEQARELVVRYRPLGEAIGTYLQTRQTPGPEDQQRANETLKKLRDFCDKTTRAGGLTDGLPGARPFLDQLQTYQANFDRDSQAYVLKKALDEALAAASRALTVGSHQECYDALPGCRLALTRYLAALEANAHTAATAPQAKSLVEGQIDVLQRRASFGVQRRLLKPAVADNASEEQFAEYNKFLATFDVPPTKAEESDHEAVKQERDKLKLMLDVKKLAGHNTLLDLLNGALSIVEAKTAKPGDKQLARTAVSNWLTMKGVKEKPAPPELRTLREIKLDSGTRKIGYFHLPTGGEQYRYWRDPKKGEARIPANGDDQFSKSNVVKGPDKLQYLDMVDRYNLAVKALASNGAKEQWSSFGKLCGDLQVELDEYRSQPGIAVAQQPDASFRDLEFENVGKVAEEVLMNWDLYRKVMAR